ncbi:hypothetical protein BDW74DRAFT_179880 [Aspergillus multicolor]|uniref:uncharacterized protein n=1 Tax=Aspergillus multicolor TaxID=41759 RepID=UPI003CCC9B71
MADAREPNGGASTNNTPPNAPSNLIVLSDPPKVAPAYCDLTRGETPQKERLHCGENDNQSQEFSATRQRIHPVNATSSDPRLRARNPPTTEVLDLTESPKKPTRDERRDTVEAGPRGPTFHYFTHYSAPCAVNPVEGIERLDRQTENIDLDALLAKIDKRAAQPAKPIAPLENHNPPKRLSPASTTGNAAQVNAVFCDLTQDAAGDHDAVSKAQPAGAVSVSSDPNLHNVSEAPVSIADSPMVVSAICELTQNEIGIQTSGKHKDQKPSLAGQEVQPAVLKPKEREAEDQTKNQPVAADIESESVRTVKDETRLSVNAPEALPGVPDLRPAAELDTQTEIRPTTQIDIKDETGPTVDIPRTLPDAPNSQPAVKPKALTESLSGSQADLNETERKADEFLKWLQQDLAQSKVQSELQKEVPSPTRSKTLPHAPEIATENDLTTQHDQDDAVDKANEFLNRLQQELTHPLVGHAVQDEVHPQISAETLPAAPKIKAEIETHPEESHAEAVIPAPTTPEFESKTELQTSPEIQREEGGLKTENQPQTQAQASPQQSVLKRALPDDEQDTANGDPALLRTPKKERIHEDDSYASTKDHFLKCLSELLNNVKETSVAIQDATDSMKDDSDDDKGRDFFPMAENMRRNLEIMHDAIGELETYTGKHLDTIAETRHGMNVGKMREQARTIVEGAQLMQEAWVEFEKICEEEFVSGDEIMEG